MKTTRPVTFCILMMGVVCGVILSGSALGGHSVWAAAAPQSQTQPDSPDAQSITVTGEIWDSACAAAGSHGAMMSHLNAKDVKECTLKCAQGGAKFVLFNLLDKTTYHLDDQEKVRQYTGQKVKVTGKYDKATNIIHIDLIDSQ